MPLQYQSGWVLWAILGCLAAAWQSMINANVPKAYLDEHFHVWQTQSYLLGHWNIWHPKITTPPGLYIIAYALLTLWPAPRPDGLFHASSFRLANMVPWSTCMPPLVLKVLDLFCSSSNHLSIFRVQGLLSDIELSHTMFNICLFPPLFFFTGLFYTDALSATSVLLAYKFYLKRQKKPLVVSALVSLVFRQTNIFWVAVFLGGLEVCRTLRKGRSGIEFPAKATFSDVISGSWRHSCVYDPEIHSAHFEDFIKTAVSFGVATLANLTIVLSILGPYFIVLVVFGVYVLWNEGVVLGDKENHTPSIHLPQMLYIWPYFVFFSFPILYPYFLNALFPPTLLPPGLRFGPTRLQLPRWIVAVSAMGTMMALVYFNTIIHPFILADNRHYMFYVFRMFILRRPFTKYLNIPVYYLCAWATMTALGGSISYLPGIDGDPGTNTAETRNGMAYKKTPSRRTNLERGHHVSFALVWLLATTFSLVTAPLVEPRYFIVPWLMWRLHVVSPLPHGDAASKARRKRPKHDHRLWLETVWFLAVNAATAYIFLYLGFEWPQEPGETQRFMW